MFNPFAEVVDGDSTDTALVARAKSGDRVALEDLVLRHQAWIYNIAVRMVFQPEDAAAVRQPVQDRSRDAHITSEPLLRRIAGDFVAREQRVYTLAHVLAERGYTRLFMTGGRGVFDGVRTFMTANGFDRFIEQSDFNNPVFVNAWGVSDEDLFHRALDELDSMHATGKPFFATLLTVSNHRPYTFPAGRISETRQSRKSAVRYADWALGDFFQRARLRPYYKDTLFVVMGDHGARVYGKQLFPIRSYRVPVLIIVPGKEKAGTRCPVIASSLDIAPTILGLLGGSYRSVFFGRNILDLKPSDGVALMQHNHDVALLDAENRMVVLGARKAMWGYELDPGTFELSQRAFPDAEMVVNATAIYQTANRLYYDDALFPGYKVPGDSAK